MSRNHPLRWGVLCGTAGGDACQGELLAFGVGVVQRRSLLGCLVCKSFPVLWGLWVLMIPKVNQPCLGGQKATSRTTSIRCELMMEDPRW